MCGGMLVAAQGAELNWPFALQTGVLLRSTHLPHSHPCISLQQNREQWPLQAELASPQQQQQTVSTALEVVEDQDVYAVVQAAGVSQSVASHHG